MKLVSGSHHFAAYVGDGKIHSARGCEVAATLNIADQLDWALNGTIKPKKKESAFQRARRLQSEAFQAAQEAVSEGAEAAKRFKDLMDHLMGSGE